MKVTTAVAPKKRSKVLFARVQPTNKAWLAKEAKKQGFTNTAAYLDSVITTVRTGR